MASPVYEHFKFEIGQFVTSAHDAFWKSQSPRIFQIVGRLYQECPGGVQLQYTVRQQERFMSNDSYERYNEIELAALPEIKTDD